MKMGYNYYLLMPSCVTRKSRYSAHEDKNRVLVHVGRSTYGKQGPAFIWNISPFDLEDMQYCTPIGEDGTIMSWDELITSLVNVPTWDLELCGKGIKFF